MFSDEGGGGSAGFGGRGAGGLQELGEAFQGEGEALQGDGPGALQGALLQASEALLGFLGVQGVQELGQGEVVAFGQGEQVGPGVQVVAQELVQGVGRGVLSPEC